MPIPTHGIIYIDGKCVPPEQAHISIFDRGFLYGDSIYETLRVYDGVAFALGEHLQRLTGSGDRIHFSLPWSVDEIKQAVAQTLGQARLGGLHQAYLRIIATRGSGAIGLDPALAVDPQLIMMCLPLPRLPDYRVGQRASIVGVTRNLKKSLDPQAKTGNYMNSVLAVAEAKRNGSDEAVMLDVQGRVAECSAANIFVLLDGVWCTPPLEVGLLEGITRRTVLKICTAEKIPVSERVLWPDDLRRAQEICTTGSVKEIAPVVGLDGQPVGSGFVGKEVPRLHRLYEAYVQAYVQRYQEKPKA